MKGFIMRASGFLVSLVLVLMAVGNIEGVQAADANAKGGAGGGGKVHVVGGDQGWDAASDLSSWALGRSFRVGDNIWFTYSAADESIAELGSREEYESCDVSNPIRMYTGGLDQVRLDRRGPRYFVSSAAGSCSKGLKLRVHVVPEGAAATAEGTVADAEGPMPSGSARIRPAVAMWAGLAVACLIGFVQSVR